MFERHVRVHCDSIRYRRGFVEVATVHSGYVNLETWEVSAEWPHAVYEGAKIPDDAFVANTELELSSTEARELAAALQRAADRADAAR